jgi:uncharacterized protein (TIGR02118 family)
VSRDIFDPCNGGPGQGQTNAVTLSEAAFGDAGFGPRAAIVIFMHTVQSLTPKAQAGDEMFNISSIYPKRDGYEFDFDYYLNKHMPRSMELLAGAKGFKGVSVERGVDIDEPKIESSFVAMCHYYFDSLEDFMAAFGPHAEELQRDIVNYTNIEPIIQINEVQISK